MLKSFDISEYRSLRSAKFSDFAQVNVMVGNNGAGKTSFLEALYLFLSQGSPEAIVGIAKRRGEYEKLQDKREWVPTVRHFFRGHEVRKGVTAITFRNGNEELSFSIGEKKFVFSDKGDLEVLSLSSTAPYVVTGQTLIMNVAHISSNGDHGNFTAPVTVQGGLSIPHKGDQGFFSVRDPDDLPMIFVSSDGVGSYAFSQMQDRIASMGGETYLADALRLLCPEVKTVGFLSADDRPAELLMNGALVELSNGPAGRIPIRTLGDGMRRLLVVAMALTCVRGGYLILDEVDAGLHYSSMSKLWKLILNTAKNNGVQVFATTHSMDCLRGLASFCGEGGEFSDDVRLFSFARKDRKVLQYTGRELAVAIENEIEVRS